MSDRVIVSAFRMQLHPGEAEAYRSRHDAIWPELSAELLAAGVVDFSIWLDAETHSLFAHLVATPDNSLAAMRDKEVMWRWWRMMADIMESNADCSPREWELLPMFRLTR